MKGSKSASGQLAFGSDTGCQSRNIREWYRYVVPRKSGPIKISLYMP
jgi:hypothetical protein